MKILPTVATLTAVLLLAACGDDASPSGEATTPSPAENANEGNACANYLEPGTTVDMVVGFRPGGSSDLWVRNLASALEEETGARFEVLNKTGAGGQIGQSFMLRGPDDGSIVSELALPSTLEFLYSGQEAPYTKDSFHFVASTGYSPNALVVSADSPFKSLQDVVDASVASPGSLNAAFNGAADDAIIYFQLEQEYGVQLNKTVFDGGNEKAQALLGGQVDLSVGAISGIADFVEAGQFRVLAVFADERSEFIPDAETAMEQGVDIVSTNRWSIAMDSAVDPCHRDALEAAIMKISESEEYAATNAQQKITTSFMSGEEFSDYWDSQADLVVRAASSND